MGDRSSIEWTDATWNPTTGCVQISPGCNHCYARTLAGRFWAQQYPLNANGSYRQFEDVRTHPDRLTLPLKWKEPRRIFVDSMSDLFHDDVPEHFIEGVFDMMGWNAKHHTYQVLTKRPQRMRDVVRRIVANQFGGEPPRNVWLGTSIELDRYCWRANYLRETPAAVRFISAEPLLGPLPNLDLTGLDWLITGGESGPGHRPCDPQWVRDLRDRCQAAHIAMFHKQWGGQTAKAGGRLLDGRTWDEFPAAVVPS